MGMVASEIKPNIFLCTFQYFIGLTTAQAIDPLPLYKDFPGVRNLAKDLKFKFFVGKSWKAEAKNIK
jgi:hypothetical protein